MTWHLFNGKKNTCCQNCTAFCFLSVSPCHSFWVHFTVGRRRRWRCWECWAWAFPSGFVPFWREGIWWDLANKPLSKGQVKPLCSQPEPPLHKEPSLQGHSYLELMAPRCFGVYQVLFHIVHKAVFNGLIAKNMGLLGNKPYPWDVWREKRQSSLSPAAKCQRAMKKKCVKTRNCVLFNLSWENTGMPWGGAY